MDSQLSMLMNEWKMNKMLFKMGFLFFQGASPPEHSISPTEASPPIFAYIWK